MGELKEKLGQLNSQIAFERGVHYKENKLHNKDFRRHQERIIKLEDQLSASEVKKFEDLCRIGLLETKVFNAKKDLAKQQRVQRKDSKQMTNQETQTFDPDQFLNSCRTCSSKGQCSSP